MTAPRATSLAQRPDGSWGLVNESGQPIADGERVTVTAGALAQSLVSHALLGLQVGRHAGSKATANMALQAGAKVVRAVAAAGVQAGVQAGAKAGAVAGVQAGAQHVIRTSRIRRTVERDEKGQITGTIEEREPR
jgi:hypothetical protein